MREEALRSVLLVKAIEETDRAGTLIPPADRAAATRQASRSDGDPTATAALERGGPLPGNAQRMLAARAQILSRQVVARHPVVDTVLALVSGPAWAGWLLMCLALLVGFALSALDGSRRIDILAFPLLGLLLWNLLVYGAVVIGWLRALLRKRVRRPVLPALLAKAALWRVRRLIARSATFHPMLAEALGRFVGDWLDAARPLLVARATRLFHLCAAAVVLGLIAGLYLRGIALDYRAGWESTFLEAPQVRAILSVLYAPGSRVTGIPIPGIEELAVMRWQEGRGGDSAAPWIHLLAATAAVFIVLPRLVLALMATLGVWWYRRHAPLPAALAPYFRSAFAAVEGVVGRGTVALMPCAYQPAANAVATLRTLLPAALGGNLAVDVHGPVRYGEEETFLQHLGDRGGGDADVIALLFNLATTPEDENHGTVIAGVRDWLQTARRGTQLLVLVDEGPYAERMTAHTASTARVGERRQVWQEFVAARGLPACFVDLNGRRPTDSTGSDADRLRASLWQPATA
jgi:hypothetical protein